MSEEQPISSGNLNEDKQKVKQSFNTALGKPDGLKVEMAEFMGVMMVSLTIGIVLLMGIATITRKVKKDDGEDGGIATAKAIGLVLVALIAILGYVAVTTAR